MTRPCRKKYGQFLTFAQNESDLDSFSALLLPDPEAVLDNGSPVSSGRDGQVTARYRVAFSGKGYFVKRYNYLGWKYALKYVLRRSKALHAFQRGLEFQTLGIPTPLPLFVAEERQWRLLRRAYLVFPFEGNAKNLLDLWPELTNRQRNKVILETAEWIAKMHCHGMHHGDLNWRNILVTKNGDNFAYSFVDLDGCKVRRPTEKSLKRDLRHYMRDIERNGAVAEYKELFLTAWKHGRNAENSFNG